MLSRWSKTFTFAVVACTLAIGIAAAHVELTVHNDFRRMFDDVGASGISVLMDITIDRTYVANPACAARRIYPASTFKIPNGLITFDTGTVRDGQEVLSYSNKPQPYEQWEHDMVLPGTIRLSAVPIYQEVARRVGFERMQVYVDVFDYDNRRLGSAINQFWLRGPPEAPAFEEARLVSRTVLKQLSVRPCARNMVRRMLLIEQQGDAAPYAKTDVATEYQPEIGWWTGWMERTGRVYTFALNTDMPREDDIARRIPPGKQLMRTLEVRPAPRGTRL